MAVRAGLGGLEERNGYNEVVAESGMGGAGRFEWGGMKEEVMMKIRNRMVME